MSLLNTLLSTILQLLVFTFVPFLVYLLKHRQFKGFLGYIGIKRPNKKAVKFALIVFAILIPIASVFYFSPDLREATSAENTVTGQLRMAGLSVSTLLQLFIIAIFKTALTEEILFRGFIAKRLIDWLGFQWGNAIQSLVFGAIHLLIFIGQPFTVLLAAAVVFLPVIVGWITGYLNERSGNGSIVPGSILHALTNLVAYWALAFG